MIEHGTGAPLVVVPGLPGSWRFIAPAVHALSASFRVLTFSLGPECTIDSDVERIVAGLAERRLDRAVICGISLGGLVALRFAARYPDRTAALVLVSSPGPGAQLRPRHRLYLRAPWLFGPVFALETPLLLRRELHGSQLLALVRAPISFSKIAKRARLIEATDIAADCARVTAPTLVVTGEPPLDEVVPVENTMEYVTAIRGATHVMLKGTGHLGTITHAPEFATLVSAFAGRAFEARQDRDTERIAPHGKEVA